MAPVNSGSRAWDKWSGYFEDVQKSTENVNQASPTMTAYYILSSEDPSLDKQWSSHVGHLIDWVRRHFGRGPFLGAWAIDEQGEPEHDYYGCCSRAGQGSHGGRWAAINALYASAINGKDQMPPKGGNRNLANIDVQHGVVYMANRSGGSFSEPSAAPAPPPTAAASAPGASAAATPVAAAAAPPVAGAARPGAALDVKAGEALMQKDGCAACHGIDKKIVGPAYVDVAAKYKGDAGAQAKLTQKIKAGGAGVWGPIPMPPNPQVPDDEIKALVSWILALKK